MSDKKEGNAFFTKNRKGQGLSTNAIILIVLGVIVLIVLIIGFTVGWSKILPFISSTNNIDTIKNSCGIACSTNSAFDYCSVIREVNDGVNPEFENNCNNLANNVEKYGSRNYGIEKCPAITCS